MQKGIFLEIIMADWVHWAGEKNNRRKIYNLGYSFKIITSITIIIVEIIAIVMLTVIASIIKLNSYVVRK